MVYVYVDSLRMAYVQNELKAHTLSDPDEIKDNDTIIFPILKKNQRSLILKNGTLTLSKIENCKLFLPFPYSFFKENNDVYYYMQDEVLAYENAKLTAAGILAYLGSLPISIFNMHFDIIGYGRCGKAIAELLEAMQLQYKIIRHDQIEENTKQVHIDTYLKGTKGDILINTAPCRLLNKQDLKEKETQYLIDISSEKCYQQEHLPEHCLLVYPGSLPNKYFAYSSAALITNYVKGR